MVPISLGLTALSVGSSLFGLFGQKSHNTAQNYGMQAQDMMLAAQENGLRQNQMNLDAVRRKRDIIRQAQVAQANATAVANNQGAGQSSALQGALAGISGQAGTNLLGVSQNQEIGNKMFDLDNKRAVLGFQRSQYNNNLDTPGTASYASGLGNVLSSGNNMDALKNAFTYLKSL